MKELNRDVKNLFGVHESEYLEEEQQKLYKNLKPRLLPNNWSSKILLIGFVILDFFSLYALWNILVQASPMVLYTIVIAVALILNVPLAVAGNVVAEYSAKLRPKKQMVTILTAAIAVFLVFFAANFGLRIAYRQATFADLYDEYAVTDNSGVGSMEETSVGVDPDAVGMAAAIVLGLCPFGTSLASFLCSYVLSDPIGERLHAHETHRTRLDARIDHLHQALEEIGDVEAFKQHMLDSEKGRYEAFLASVDRKTGEIMQTAFTELEKKVSDPDKLTRITADAALVQSKGPDALLSRQDPFPEAEDVSVKSKEAQIPASAAGAGTGWDSTSRVRVAAFVPENPDDSDVSGCN